MCIRDRYQRRVRGFRISRSMNMRLVGVFLFLLPGLFCVCYGATCDNRLPKSHHMSDGFCPQIVYSGLRSPRQLAIADNNDLLVCERSIGQISVLYDESGNGIYKHAQLAKAPGLNHAVLIHKDYLYASSASTVFRWRYKAGDRSDLGAPQVVVDGIPTCCDHVTRTMIFDKNDRFYVQQGSGSNVDANITHSVIHRWPTLDKIPENGFDWFSGELFAYGLRNEVGLRFDTEGKLWGVENGVDNLHRADLGGDIHANNPSEELNLFDSSTPGRFYGYPYCWSQGNLTENHGNPPGTQWAYPTFMSTHTDAWCNNDANVVKPILNMPAHYAPLDINFYEGSQWPAEYRGSAFVASHGSWNRQPSAGYRVLRIPFKDGMPTGIHEPFLWFEGPGEVGAGWQRPVSIVVGKCPDSSDCMFVSSDSTGTIIAISYSEDFLSKH
eukprot:TRINITY_DN671_c0_g1_i1.p1 TRINITY_DN671_c0_g1~~TRINITY_DN671_c0_g1_i1.p1  ORF type:complete len:439 (-),score=33.23 TRINITY_DN671_c0_g1_i1:87-1403(-)